MSPEALELISVYVRSGCYDREQLQTMFEEELYEPGELDPEEVQVALDAEIARLHAAQAAWPAVTDCDRLDEAFLALSSQGIIALQNAGFTQSDGYSDFQEALQNTPDPDEVVGYCFYHSQDLEVAVRGYGLHLAFGPAHPKDEASRGVAVGRIIRQELAAVGLPVQWDGTFSSRILIPRLVWQRRWDAP